MADSPAFDLACEFLERESSLDRLEARGTIRLALKSAGLEARSVTPHQLEVIIEKVLPAELSTRGVEGVEALCESMRAALGALDVGHQAETPEAVFARLGGAS